MLERALLFCKNEDEEKKSRVVRELENFFEKNFSPEKLTVELAYERNKIIENIIKKKNPLKELKERSFSQAKKLYPKLKDYVTGIKEPKERFRRALMIALAGNIVEFGAKEHNLDLKNLEEEIWKVVKEPLAIDEIDEVYEKVKTFREILYVTDNTGELIFDQVFIEELRKQTKIYIAPLSRPCQDDATQEDVKRLELGEEIIPRSDFIGVWFPRCEEKFLRKWGEVDFIIAKGMACYETLNEYPEKTRGMVVSIFKAKCSPVAKEVGVELRDTVVKIL